MFWDVALCCPLKVNQGFGRTCRLQLQGRRISQARKQREAVRGTASYWLPSWIILRS
jgi:hypothetical protein